MEPVIFSEPFIDYENKYFKSFLPYGYEHPRKMFSSFYLSFSKKASAFVALT